MHWAYSSQAKIVKYKLRIANLGKRHPPRSLSFRRRASLRMRGNRYACGNKSEEHKRKISEAHKRIGSPWMIGKKLPPFTEEHRRNISLAMSGSNNHGWKGGISVINNGVRYSARYQRWRKLILKRDGRCVKCGSRKNLHVDHIKRFSDFPRLRFVLSNGRVLCKKCHENTPTYGNKKHKKVI